MSWDFKDALPKFLVRVWFFVWGYFGTICMEGIHEYRLQLLSWEAITCLDIDIDKFLAKLGFEVARSLLTYILKYNLSP